MLGGLFHLESTGTHELKGFAHPVPAWRVLGEAAVESRFAAIRTGTLPLVGRAHEMGLMLERWRLARSGEGQIVTVVGEAGIGKSRAIEALQEDVAHEPHTRIHLQCSPYHRDSALYPVIQHLARAAGFAPADSADARIDKLRVMFARRAASDETAVPLLAELLSIPAGASLAQLSLTPAQRKAATIALLVDEIVRLGESDPVLLVLEDAHWIDPTTLELMTRLADSLSHARLLALVSARPDFAPPWLTRPQATLLTLESPEPRRMRPAGRQRRRRARLAGGNGRGDRGQDRWRATLRRGIDQERGGIGGRGQRGGAGDAQGFTDGPARPPRRGARGGADRRGHRPAIRLLCCLSAIAARDGAALDAALDKLVAAGIVFPEGRGLERSYSFKHALVRDAAYESLLLGRRREWHERIARALEQGFPELVANEPELLAYHFAEGGSLAQACDYRMRAGDRAVSRSAYQEEVAHFSAGLRLADALPDPADQARRQLDFLLKLGPALMVVRGMQSAEVEDAYRRAADLGIGLGDDAATFKAKWGLWLNATIKRKTALGRERARELVTLAQRSSDGELLLEAYHCRWSTAFFRGDVAEALDNTLVGVETYDLARHRHLGHAFGGHDPGVCAHVVRANALQLSGDALGAKASARQGVALAETLGHPNTLGHALHNACMAHQLGGEREAALAAAQRAADLAEKFALSPWRASSLVVKGWATAVGGVEEAARLIDREIDKATAAGPVPQYYLGLAAEVLLAAGRPADGLAHLDRAIATVDEPGVGFYLPEIYRLRGECLLALGRDRKEEARQAFATARDVARQQGAVIFERRAEASLAEVANSTGV